jgi:hypothetical protein
MGLPGMDERTNTVEYFVHHEDVRRAVPGWEPRELAEGEEADLWRRLRMARMLLRKAPVGVELARDDHGVASGDTLRITARNATPVVTVIGTPAELTLWALGRTAVAGVRFDGTDAAVTELAGTRWGLGLSGLSLGAHLSLEPGQLVVHVARGRPAGGPRGGVLLDVSTGQRGLRVLVAELLVLGLAGDLLARPRHLDRDVDPAGHKGGDEHIERESENDVDH